jgi:putative flippase GtrA
VPFDLATLRSRLEHPEHQKKFRYAATSLIAVAISLVTFAICNGPLAFPAAKSNIIAFVASTIPTYYLNRNWAWGKSGHGHLLKEVAPFWVLALAGLAFTTAVIHFFEQYTEELDPHALTVLANMAVLVAASGVFWVIRFTMLNRFLFRHDDIEVS